MLLSLHIPRINLVPTLGSGLWCVTKSNDDRLSSTFSLIFFLFLHIFFFDFLHFLHDRLHASLPCETHKHVVMRYFQLYALRLAILRIKARLPPIILSSFPSSSPSSSIDSSTSSSDEGSLSVVSSLLSDSSSSLI